MRLRRVFLLIGSENYGIRVSSGGFLRIDRIAMTLHVDLIINPVAGGSQD